MRKPNLFIVGFPKSGTTALYNFLRQHPQVFMTPAKEPFFFSTEAPKRKVFNLDQYLKLFDEAEDEKIVGEASTNYIYSDSAPGNIHEFNPDANIVVMMREPVDFLYSFYHHGFRDARRSASFLDWEKQERMKSTDKRVPERVKYEKYLKRYISLFGKKKVKTVIFEDFKSDNILWFQEVLKFLGVEPGFVPEINKYNRSRQPRFKYINKILKQAKITVYLRKIVPYKFWHKSTSFIDRNILLKDKKYDPLDPDMKLKLMKDYKPEVEKISELLDMDMIKKWNYDKIS